MFPFIQQVSEFSRQGILHSYNILDTLEEKDFDAITTLAAAICQAPISLISLLDEHRQWFKSHKGLNFKEIPIEHSFCTYTIAARLEIMVVKDAQPDKRFQHNSFVTGQPGICFYAGVPLINEEGFALGTLCVVDVAQRELSDEQQESLKTLAQLTMTRLELRRKIKTLEEVNSALSTSEQKVKGLLNKLEETLDSIETALDSAQLGTWSKKITGMR